MKVKNQAVCFLAAVMEVVCEQGHAHEHEHEDLDSEDSEEEEEEEANAFGMGADVHAVAAPFLAVLDHAGRCFDDAGCALAGCAPMKALIAHSLACHSSPGCRLCKRFRGLLHVHHASCNRAPGTCFVPHCFDAAIVRMSSKSLTLLDIATPLSTCVSEFCTDWWTVVVLKKRPTYPGPLFP